MDGLLALVLCWDEVADPENRTVSLLTGWRGTNVVELPFAVDCVVADFELLDNNAE